MTDSVTRSLLKAEAKRRGWKTETVGPQAYFLKVTHPDGRWELFRGSRPSRSSANGHVIAEYKHLTPGFVNYLGYETPDYELFENIDQATRFLHKHGTIVIKPVDGARSEGVTVGITSLEKLTAALDYAKKFSHSGDVLLQRQIEGKLYRLTVINGKLVAAGHRKAPEAIGDGQHTVRELVEIMNNDPRRGHGNDTPLKTISIEDVEDYIGSERMNSVMPSGEILRLLAIDSVSAGGEAINVTETVHEDWRKFVEHVATEAGLFIAGFDVMCKDIAAPLDGNYIPILEVNSAPGFKLHQYPTAGGDPVELAPIMLDAVFN